MDISSHVFSNLNNNQSLHSGRNPVYPVSSNLSESDENRHLMQVHNSTQGIFNNELQSEVTTDFTGMNHMRSEQFSQNNFYFHNSLAPLSSRYNSFPQLGQSGSRKHLLSGVVRTRRRKAGINEEDRVCIVCGEPASGYNFDRLTCESCKAFFRRNALKSREKIKACTRGGGCAIEGNQRKHCPSCRLEKCLAVGMKRELILPPEKLEQRAKPRRRKHHSPQGSTSPPHILTGPSSAGSSNTTAYPSFMPSPHSTTHMNSSGHPHNSLLANSNFPLQFMNSLEFANFLNANQQQQQQHQQANDLSQHLTDAYSPNSTANAIGNKTSNFNASSLLKLSGNAAHKTTDQEGFVHQHQNESHDMMSIAGLARPNYKLKLCKRLSRTNRTGSGCRTLCKRHRHCRLLARRKRRRQQRMFKLQRISINNVLMNGTSLVQPDPHLLTCLQDCIRRIREPFTPEEQLETGVAVTLEQEYNRMDACIRRIIRVVKLLPYFGDVGKPAQLRLLRTNIYGLIVLYSSFFFERDIRKLRYPVLQPDGELTTVTVSMLDEVVTPSSNSSSTQSLANCEDECDSKSTAVLTRLSSSSAAAAAAALSLGALRTNHHPHTCQTTYATELREEFELYKANTLAAFDHLDQLIHSDDVLRMSLLAVKLFTDSSLPDDMRDAVCAAQQTYSTFLWNYIRWRVGPKKLRLGTEKYARLLIAFIDLRTLEIRMTEFAKLLSLDGLSPLMREVCSQRSALGSSTCS